MGTLALMLLLEIAVTVLGYALMFILGLFVLLGEGIQTLYKKYFRRKKKKKPQTIVQDRYIFQNSGDAGWCICHDNENNISLKWRYLRFNDTARGVIPQNPSLSAADITRSMREMIDWLNARHKESL